MVKSKIQKYSPQTGPTRMFSPGHAVAYHTNWVAI